MSDALISDLNIHDALRAASILAGNTINTRNDSGDSGSLVRARLQELQVQNLVTTLPEHGSTTDMEFFSAKVALFVIEQIHNIVLRSQNQNSDKPLLGSRDLSNVRTLLTLVFRWGTQPVLARLAPSWSAPSTRTRPSQPVIDLTGNPTDEETLHSLASRLLQLVLGGLPSPISGDVGDVSDGGTSPITPILVDKHLSDILHVAIAIGWLPQQMISCAGANYEKARSAVMALLQILPASTNIASLGRVLQSNIPPIPHLRKSASFLLSRQLLRPDGVRGLYATVFGETNADLEVEETSSVDRLEHVARSIGSVPFGIPSEDYFKLIVPKCIGFLEPVEEPLKPSWLRASAFTLSRFLTNQDKNSSAKDITLHLLHGPFGTNNTASTSPLATLRILSSLILNTDPVPGLMSILFSTILPRIYTLLEGLSEHRMADPNDIELCNSIITTWARIVEADEAREVLWSIVRGEGGQWVRENENEWKWEEKTDKESASISVSDFLNGDAQDTSQSTNPFNLRPSPQTFVMTLQEIKRPDITSEIFVRLLNSYIEFGGENENGDSLRALLYLQLILQIQTQILQSDGGQAVLAQPEKILSFILHVLEVNEPQSYPNTKAKTSGGLRMEDLRIVEDEEDVDNPAISGADSDDEDEEQADLPSDLTSTALNLLLSILEAHQDISTHTSPTLDRIWDKLDEFAKGDDLELRSLVREARMVMASRLANPPSSSDSKPLDDTKAAAQVKYQKALKLLQDPILPVRAHGLTLLKELVSPALTKKKSTGNTVSTEPVVERALVPAIMAIFIQCIQEEDSYIFLNAVQGLSAMVDGFGKETLAALVNEYSKGMLEPPIVPLTKVELDTRLRVGEALGQVIRRSGEALSAYSNLIIPHLMLLVRQRDAPVVLRISALSLLGQCAETNLHSLDPYLTDLSEGMIDLLQIESAANQPKSNDKTLDSDPTTIDAKLSEFRRSALHFLSILTRSFVMRQHDALSQTPQSHKVSLEAIRNVASHNIPMLAPETTRRMMLTLRYVVATESDAVAKVMARELIQLLEDT